MLLDMLGMAVFDYFSIQKLKYHIELKMEATHINNTETQAPK